MNITIKISITLLYIIFSCLVTHNAYDVFCCGAWGNGVIRVQETITTIHKEPQIGNISK